MKQASRSSSHFVDGSEKSFFIRLGRLGEPADFADKLKRRCLDFFRRDGRVKVEKCFDIPAHRIALYNSKYHIDTGSIRAGL
jgi:hypothetical protein